MKDWAAQFAFVNSALEQFGLAPVAPRRRNAPLTPENVQCKAGERCSGPLVSVLMTAWNCADTIDYAAKSVLTQSYDDLELIIIDDASTDATAEKVRKLAARDRRVKPVFLSANGGTYVAKNQGLLAAQGEFVTSQDSDDWAHPAKIATLVAALQESPDLVGAAVSHLRCNRAKGIQARGYVRPDASSLMFRRAPVLERIGFYDSARAGADSEFAYRIERAFGRAAINQLPHLLSLVLWSETSLSGGGEFVIDDDAGVFSPSRNAYRRSFCEWQESTADLRIDFPLARRPFPVPLAMQP
jgi:glycosyltransferase involved in cell wall biosynthesis